MVNKRNSIKERNQLTGQKLTLQELIHQMIIYWITNLSDLPYTIIYQKRVSFNHLCNL